MKNRGLLVANIIVGVIALVALCADLSTYFATPSKTGLFIIIVMIYILLDTCIDIFALLQKKD